MDGRDEVPGGPGERGSLAFFATWLLLHEKADDWLRDALRRARDAPDGVRSEYQRFLLAVDREKEHLKGFLGDALRNEIRRMGFVDGDQVDVLRAELAESRQRLRALEDRLARLGGAGDG